MTSIQLSFPQNDDGTVCVHVVARDGTPIDLAPFPQITFTLKRSTQDLDSEAVFQGTLTGGAITLLQPTEDGVCEVAIPSASSSQMMIGRPYYWTLKLTNSSNKISTPVYGTLIAATPIQRRS